MAEVMARSIEPHHFVERRKGDTSPVPLPGEVYAWMVGHLRRYRSVPSMELARSIFPSFEFIDSTDSLEAIVDQMVALVKRRELIEGLREGARIADDPERVKDAEVHMFEIAAALARAVPSSSISRFSDSLNLLKLYEERERTGQTPGVSFAVPELDALTYGGQRHEMVIIEGFLGQRKSSLAVAMSAKAYFERGQTPLFFSLEMEGEKLQQKWIAMQAGFQYSAIKRLELEGGDKENWKRIAERAFECRFEKDILVRDDMRRPTEDQLYAEIERWKPDFFVVDTLDEVRAPSYYKSLHERQDHIARELKGICRSTKRMGLVVAQANRDAATEGAKIANIAGSITIARKADIAIGLHADDTMKKMHKIRFELLKNRDDGGEGTICNAYFNPGTMELRPWLPTDNIMAKTAA